MKMSREVTHTDRDTHTHTYIFNVPIQRSLHLSLSICVLISGCKQKSGLLSSCGPWHRIDPLQSSSRRAGALEGLSRAPNQ